MIYTPRSVDRLVKKACIVDLLDQEVRHVRPAVACPAPARRISLAPGRPIATNTPGPAPPMFLSSVGAQIAHGEIEPRVDLPVRLLGQTNGTGLGDTF
jgi:hypothetical protein